MTLSILKNKILSIEIANRAEGRKRYLFLLELAIISIIYLLSLYLWSNFKGSNLLINPQYLYLGAINIFSWVLLYRLTIIAKLPRTQRYTQIFFNFVRVAFFELIFLFVFKFSFGLKNIDPIFLILYSGLNLFVLFHFRVITFRLFRIFRAKGYDLHRVLVIADSYSDLFIERLLTEKEWGFHIVAILSNSKLIRNKFKDLDVRPLQSDLKNLIDKEVIDEVIYSKGKIDSEQLKEITRLCNEVGVIFRLQSALSPLENLKLQMQTLSESEQLSLADSPSNNLSQFLKYVSDLYFSFFMLIMLSPIFLFIALVIKIDAPGPVFFKQERVGLRGRRFWLYKFRTMVINAEEVLEQLKDKNESDGPAFKMKNDPRITRIGRILRKTGLDELPQLYNVFKGEMSLIGPRPPLPKEVAQYERWQLRRLSVKPGITCTWQIVPNRNDVSFEKWMKLDLQYIDNWTFQKDIELFFKTIKTFFTATGH
jgi:exopolysaccharide biosynthesis polyprenyl glycosylphosphotransferase